MFRPFRARVPTFGRIPGRCPGLICGCPFGATDNDAGSVAAVSISCPDDLVLLDSDSEPKTRHPTKRLCGILASFERFRPIALRTTPPMIHTIDTFRKIVGSFRRFHALSTTRLASSENKA